MENENEVQTVTGTGEVQAVTVTGTGEAVLSLDLNAVDLQMLGDAYAAFKKAGMFDKPAAGEKVIDCAISVIVNQHDAINTLAAGLERLKKFGFENS